MAFVILLAVLGLCWGSFAATLSERWPLGRSIIRPASACDACGKALRWTDLVPLVSYLTTRGRCAMCSSPIPRRYPLFELASAGIGVVSALAVPGPAGLWGAILGWQLLLLAVLDAEHFWLPNPLVACLALSGAANAILTVPDALRDRGLGGLLGFAILSGVAALYRALRGKEGLGGGDPKLFGAIGLWTGWSGLSPILLLAAGMGLGFAVLTPKSDSQGGDWRTRRLPFGTFLAAAAWLWWHLGW